MRDVLLTLFVAALLPVAFKRPWVGALLFAWMSIMNPHKLTWDFANGFPWAQLIAIVTLTGFLFAHGERKRFPLSGLTVVYLMLMVWMTVTSFFALGIPEWIQARWTFVMKIHLMILVTLMLIRGRRQIDWLVWVVVGSVAFYGVKGGVFTVMTGGSGRVWGPPGGMIEDNNALAVALVMMVPLLYYLISTNPRRWVKISLWLCLVSMGLAILGTQSRGALLALVAMAAMLGLKSKHRLRASLLIVFAVLVAVGFMPDSWSNRMDTIQNYRVDSSAMTRIYSWLTQWNLALDRPFVGGGFGTDTLSVFRRYAPTEEPFNVYTGTVWVAHNIYFQALGEHGFVGLGLFVTLGFLTWRMASSVSKRAANDGDSKDWAPLLMRMCQVSVVGYAIGGSFLSLMNLDVIYYLMAIIVMTDASLREAHSERVKALPATLGPRSMEAQSPRKPGSTGQPAMRS